MDDGEGRRRPWARWLLYLVLFVAVSSTCFLIVRDVNDGSDTRTRSKPAASICRVVDDVVVSLRAFAADPTASRQGDVDEDLRRLSREANASGDDDLSAAAGQARIDWAAYSRARASGSRTAEETAWEAVGQAISAA